MAKKVAPPKLTGGGGFVFEDKVVAYFLSCLLTGRAPIDPELGAISRIDFQTRVDGWLLDDILLTLTSSGETRHCAFSIKSNQQFTKNAAPKEFVLHAWEQFLHEVTTTFDKAHDRLGLVTTPLPQGIATKLYSLLRKSRSQDPKDLPIRLLKQGYASDQERKLFSSFACPTELAKKYGITEANTCELLRCIEVLQFDFEHEPSTRLQLAVQNCQDTLMSGSLEEAQLLWESLLTIASKYRPSSGYLDLIRLIDQLRPQFRLKDYPNYHADWNRLLSQTKGNLSVISDKIGNTVSLPRNSKRAELDTALIKGKAIVLLGPSGCGKTVIAKLWTETKLDSSKVIWWNARSFDVQDFPTFESHLELNHSLQDILATTSDPCAYMIIDGLDRVFSDSAFENLSALIHELRLNIEASPWRIIITCQPEEWNRIQVQLARVNVPPLEWQTIEVKEPTADELEPVWKAFPALQRLRLQPQLQSLLLKPKVLDLIATKLSVGGSVDTSKWVGESDLIEWFWETEVSKSPHATMRSGFIMRLGEKQADDLQAETPTDVFSIADRAPLDGLLRDRICKLHEERLSFYHDLYGDWARQRVLLGMTNTLREYLEAKLSSPLWHRAVRLYGLHLLEKNKDLKQWRSAVGTIASEENKANLAQDLLVESVIFATNPFPLLERLWPDLKANDGLLLQRLLGRFLHVATLPNPIILNIAKTLGSELETEAATIQRIPYWPYWLPMLQFLHRHLEDVIELASRQIAEISDTWLRRGAENWPLRREAAELALAAAERILRFKQDNGARTVIKDELDEVVYRATLAGAHELPDRVADFALEASKRKECSTQKSKQDGETEKTVRKATIYSVYGTYGKEIPPPWPDGPSRRVDEAFQEICLNTDALYPLIISNPGVAMEVLLALLIKEPRARDTFDTSHFMTI